MIRGEGSADHLSPGCDSLAAGDVPSPDPAFLSFPGGDGETSLAAGVESTRLDIPRRRDELPEYHDYADTGCNLFRSCLGCPLPACRFDDEQASMNVRLGRRAARVMELVEAGVAVDAIASEFGVSKRTVFRDLSRRGVA